MIRFQNICLLKLQSFLIDNIITIFWEVRTITLSSERSNYISMRKIKRNKHVRCPILNLYMTL